MQIFCHSLPSYLYIVLFINLAVVIGEKLVYDPHADTSCGQLPFDEKLRTSFVINGDPVTEKGLFPWLVNIRRRTDTKKVVCTGVAITDTLVLTAAHCFRNDNKKLVRRYKFWVYFGSHNVSATNERGRVRLAIRRFYIHPRNRYDVYSNDLAIVRVTRSVRHLQPICLPCVHGDNDQPFVPERNEKCLVAGWGTTTFFPSTEASQVPIQATLSVISRASCERHWGDVIDDTMLCAGEQNGAMPCRGDSGVPLMCYRGDRWFVSGIVSWGSEFCGLRPTVFSNIAKLRNWITRILRIAHEEHRCLDDNFSQPSVLPFTAT